MGMVERTCGCGKKFQAREADVKRGWAKSCSKACAARLREQKTGNYKRFCALRDKAERLEFDRETDRETYGETFSNAHQFDNCEK